MLADFKTIFGGILWVIGMVVLMFAYPVLIPAVFLIVLGEKLSQPKRKGPRS